MKVTSLLSLFLSFIQFLSPVHAQSDRKVELVVQTSHLISIYSVAFSPDGQILASAEVGSIILWEVKSGRQIRTFTGDAPVAFGPDGKTLASVSDGKNIKLWDIITGKEIRTLEGHTSKIRSLAFNYDGTMLASGEFGTTINSDEAIPAGVSRNTTIKLWNAQSGKVIHTLTGHASEIGCLAFSADGKILASGSGGVREDNSTSESSKAKSTFYDTIIKLWDVERGVETHTLLGHDNPIISLRIKANEKTLVSASSDHVIKLWDIESGVEKRSISGPKSQTIGGVLSPDGNVFASSTIEAKIELINVSTGEVIRRFAINVSGFYLPLPFSPDKKFASLSLAFSPDGQKLASADIGALIIFWDIETGSSFFAARKRVFAVTSVRFSPDGKTLASANRLNTIKLWNVGDVTEPKTLRTFDVPLGTMSVDFSPNGNTMASTNWLSHNIELWDVKSGTKLKTLKAHSKEILSLSFSVDGKKLVSESEDKTVKIWDVENGNLLESLNADEPETKKKLPELFKGFSDNRPVRIDSYDKLIAVAAKTDTSLPNKIVLFERETEKELCALVAIDESDWAVITPEGRFDTNIDLTDIDVLHWRITEDPLIPFPLEVLMRGYYEPNLLARILRCNEQNDCDREFKPLPSIADINRVQPKVAIREIKPVANASDLVDVTVEVENVTDDVNIFAPDGTMKKRLSSGVFDLRLFRDGQLVGGSTPKENLEAFINDAPRLMAETKASGRLIDTPEDRAWRAANDIFKLKSENVKFVSPGKALYTFRNVKLPKDGRKVVEFTAYAFNSDKVKSATTAPFRLSVPAAIANAPKKGRAFLISIGVNASENPAYDLRYAANDARRMQEVVGARLKTDNSKYSEIIQIPLLSDYGKDKNLSENKARKAIIKGVFSLLAGNEKEVPAEVLKQIPGRDKIKPVEPEDVLIITYSGHGYADQSGIFYLLPYDVGKSTKQPSVETLKRTISSDELSLWIRDITAKEMLMIIDACHSAEAVQGNDFKPGPMGSRGLGQLAYDKGMSILAATQADNVALELEKLQQGLLSYALIKEGIEDAKADTEVEFKQLTVAEWLGYAVNAVPRLYEEIFAGRRELLIGGKKIILGQKGGDVTIDISSNQQKTSGVNLQQPSLFDFRRKKVSEVLFNLR